MSYMVPYVAKRHGEEGPSQDHETGDVLPQRVLAFLNQTCRKALELHCIDGSVISINEYLDSGGVQDLVKVVRIYGGDAPYDELGALAVLRASVTVILLCEALDYVSCAGKSTGLDSRYLGTLCSNLEELVRLNDEICLHESQSMASSPATSSDRRFVAKNVETVTNETPRNRSTASGTSLWSRTHCKQTSASESAFMAFLLDIGAEEIFCFLATEVVREQSFTDETVATALVRLSIRFLLIGAEIAMESKSRAQRSIEEQERLHRSCLECLVLAGQSVGSICARFPSIDMESWLIAAEDFGEGCSFGTANIHVPFFCGMMNALDAYCKQKPVEAACKRALLMLLRLLGPAEESVNRYRKGSRARTLQSPEQLASQLIGSARTKISLTSVAAGARNLISRPLAFRGEFSHPVTILPSNPSLDHIFRVCGRFLQKTEDPSEDSSFYAFLKLLSTVMVTAASHALSPEDGSGSHEGNASSTQGEPSDSAEQQSMLGNIFMEPNASTVEGDSSIDGKNYESMVHLEIVNLSIQGLTVLIDFIPRKATPGLYELYSSSMRTARLLPLERLHSSMASVLSSRLRTLLVSAPRGHQDAEIMSKCHAHVINAFVETGLGGLMDPLGARHEGFFLAYIVLKSEREARQPGLEGPDFVSTLLQSFVSVTEKAIKDDESTTITFSTILLITYAYNALQSLEQRTDFVMRLSAVIERAVKVIHDNAGRRYSLQAILTVLSVLDFCTRFYHDDRVPSFLENEIEHEIFCSSKRGLDGSVRFQQLMASQAKQTGSSSAASSDAGPTSSCLETLLDTICEEPWELKVGEFFCDSRKVSISEFVEVTWRILDRLPSGMDSGHSKAIGGLSSKLNELRTGSQSMRSRTLAKVASDSFDGDIRLKDCMWVTAYSQALIQRGCKDSEDERKESLIEILAVASRLIHANPKLLEEEPQGGSMGRALAAFPTYTICSVGLISARDDGGYSLLHSALLRLLEAGVHLADDLPFSKEIIWNSASLAAGAVIGQELHNLLLSIAQKAAGGERISLGLNSIDIVFHAHRIALFAKNITESDVDTECWLTLLEKKSSVPDAKNLVDAAASYVFGGVTDEKISELIPRCSLKDALLRVVENGMEENTSRMLLALLKLAQAPDGSGWATSVRKAVADIAQDESSFTRLTTRILPSTKAASSLVFLFETADALGGENSDRAIRALERSVLNRSVSSASLLQTIDLMLVIAMKDAGESAVLKLVLTYYALLRSCWDEEKLRPKVLEANLKSCLLVQRIVRIHDALDADGGALRPIEWSSEISDIGENETDHGKSASDQCNVQGDTSAAVEETDDVDESDDSDHDSYSPDRVAAMCCTFTETGRQFVEQHWYYCYTCGMTWGEGICRVCALVCHKDHEISYSRQSRFFCDCGAGASETSNNNAIREGANGPVTTCMALEPRLSPTGTGNQSHSTEDQAAATVAEIRPPSQGEMLGSKLAEECPTIWSDDEHSVRRVLQLASKLKGSRDFLNKVKDSILASDNLKTLIVAARGALEFGEGRLFVAGLLDLSLGCTSLGAVEARKDVVELRASARTGTLILRKAEAKSSMDAHIGGSLLAFNGGGIISVVDPGGKLILVDAKGVLSGNEGAVDSSILRTVCQVDIPAGFASIEANEEAPHDLVLSNNSRVLFVRVDEKHEFQRKIFVEVGLDDGAVAETKLVRTSWVKGMRNLLSVVCTTFVKVFDITEDVLSPTKFLVLPDDADDVIVDAVCFSSWSADSRVWKERSQNQYSAVCVTKKGRLYKAVIHAESEGPQTFSYVTSPNESYGSNAVSVTLARWSSSLWVVLESGSMVLYRYDYESEALQGSMCFHQVLPNALKSVSFESLDAPDYFMSHITAIDDTKTLKAFRLHNGCLHHQTLESPSTSSSARIVGAVPCEASGSGAPDKPSGLLLLEDGSIHRTVFLSEGFVSLPSRPAFDTIGDDTNAVENSPELLPQRVGFFENCQSTFNQITWSGDILRCGGGMTSDEVKFALWGPAAGCIVAPTANVPFKIRLSTGIRTNVIVGIRMQFGHRERTRCRVPAKVKVFNRTAATLTQGARRWVDIPFTVPESMASPRDVTIELEPQNDRASDGFCAFDSLEVHCVNVSQFENSVKAYERKVARLKRERLRLQRKTIQRQHFEEQARSSALKNRGSPEEIMAMSAIRVAEKNQNILPEFLRMFVELEQAQGKGTRVRNRCNEVLQSHYRSEIQLYRAINLAALERLYSQAKRATKYRLYAPRDIEELIFTVAQHAEGDFTHFEEFLRGKDAVSFCRSLFHLHQIMQHAGRRVLHQGREFTTNVIKVLFASFRVLVSEEEKESIALLVFVLLSCENEEVRNVTSNRLSQMITTEIESAKNNISKELFKMLIRRIIAYLSSQRSRSMGLGLFDSLSFIHRLITEAKHPEKVLSLLHNGSELKSCLRDRLENTEIWEGRSQSTFDESFLLLRLFVAAAGSNQLDENLKKTLFWDSSLFEGLSSLLDRLRPRIEENFSALAAGDQSKHDLEDDSQELPRAAQFLSINILEPLLSREICENILLVGGSNVRSSSAILTVEAALELLLSLWPLRSDVASTHVDHLRRCACVYAHLFKHKAQNLNSFWISILRATSTLAKNLLFVLCDLDRAKYYSERDKFFYQQCLLAVVESQQHLSQEVLYDEQVRMSEALSGMLGLAVKRPWNWREFCRNGQGDEETAVDILLKVASNFDNPLQLHCMQLLAGAFAASNEDASAALQKTDDQDESETQQSSPERDFQVDSLLWTAANSQRLNYLVQNFCLGSNSREVRVAATRVLKGLFLTSKKSNADVHKLLQQLILKWVPYMAVRGRHGAELSTFLCLTVQHTSDNPEYCRAVSVAVYDAFETALEFLSRHPNAHLYKALSDVLVLDGHYVESEVCVSCASHVEDTASKMTRLENIRAEAKYTDRAILCRLNCQQAVSAVALKVVHMGRSCRVRSINILYSCRAVTDVSELKSAEHPWKHSKTIKLGLRQSDVRVTFPIPVIASNLMFEFAEFHTTDGDGVILNERLSCPRCSRTVSDRHGICRNCHENAYQCRNCRNINYENLDAFICNECGHCKHNKFEFSLQCAPSYTAERITNEADRIRTVEMIDAEITSVHKQYEHLRILRETIQKFLNDPNDTEESIDIAGDIADLIESDRGQPENEAEPESPLAALLNRLSSVEAAQEGGAPAAIDRSVPVGGGGSSANNARGGNSNNAFVRRASSSSTATVTTRVNKRTAIISSVYGRDCASVFNSLCKSIQGLTAMRKELLRYSFGLNVSNLASSDTSKETVRCFGCAKAFVTKCVETMTELTIASEHSKGVFAEKNVGLHFLENDEILRLCGASTSMSRKLISHIAATSPLTMEGIFDRLARKLQFCTTIYQPLIMGDLLLEDMNVLERLSTVENCDWEKLFKEKLLSYFFNAGESRSAPLAEHIVLPFVRILDRVANTPTSENASARLQTVLGDRNFTSWGIQTIMFSPTADVRKTTSRVLKALNSATTEKYHRFVDQLSDEPLATASEVGENSAEFFDLFEEMLESTETRSRAVRGGLLSRLGGRIAFEAGSLKIAEAKFDRFRFSQGFVLCRLVGLLKKVLCSPVDMDSMTERSTLITSVLKAYIAVRNLVVQRTKLTDECAVELLKLLSGMDQLGGKREVLRVFIEETVKANEVGDRRSEAVLLEQLAEILCPAKSEPVFNLIFNKSPTQEEYIRGNLSRNFYPSNTVGTTMRDVKNKICRDLDLTTVLEDDFGMELLVAGNLLSLDLSIRSVYEHIWRPSLTRTQSRRDTSTSTSTSPDPPMVVVYRLSGLDGEATEPMVENLVEPADEQIDPEEEFADTVIFAEYGGLEVLMSILSQVKSWDMQENNMSGPTLKLLRASCQLASNRRLLAKKETLLALLESSAAAFASEGEEAVKSAEILLSNSAKVLSEYKQATASNGNETETMSLDKKDVMSLLQIFLSRLDMSTSSGAEATLLGVLPFICRDVREAQQMLIDYFLERHQFLVIDTNENTQKVSKRLYQVLNAATSSRDEFIRATLMEKGLGKDIGEYLRAIFPYPRSEHLSEWNDALCLQGPVLGLRLLAGLTSTPEAMSSKYQEHIIECFSGLLPILTTLETVTSASSIGAVAEELLEKVMILPDIQAEVKKLRQEIKDARRAAAAAKRNAILQEAGVITAAEAANLSLPPQLSAASIPDCIRDEGLEDEVGPTCVICRDGFCSRPSEVLALYVFNKRVPINAYSRADDDCGSDSSATTTNSTTSSDPSLNYLYSTVTHFHAIHISCHREAVRVDRSMRQPRDEWDGATVRNSQTKCNNLFPIQPPALLETEMSGSSRSSSNKTSKRSYADAVDQYFLRMHALGASGFSQLQLVVHDLARSLARFASGDATAFSKDTRGGGPHSNASFIPYLMQMALHLASVHKEDETSVLESLNTYLNQGGEMCAFYLSVSICLQPLERWLATCDVFLTHALAEFDSSAALSLIAIANSVQVRMKKDLSSGDWRTEFRRRLNNDEEIVGAVKNIVSVYENYGRIANKESFLRAVEASFELPEEAVETTEAFEPVLKSLSSSTSRGEQ